MGIQLSDGVENIVGKGEIFLFMSNFSFSHNVFESCLLLMLQNEYLWSKGLRIEICYRKGKHCEKMLVTSIFSCYVFERLSLLRSFYVGTMSYVFRFKTKDYS